MNRTALVLVAEVCHEANRTWCSVTGDDSQVAWDDAEVWQRNSAVNGVQYLAEHPNAGVTALHDNWMKEKLAAGWVWGMVKDAEAKTHPCLRPFHDLPPAQQAKDILFAAIVGALLETVVRRTQTAEPEPVAVAAPVADTPRGRRG